MITKPVALVIAILLIIALLVTFIVSYVLYKRTPAPKGCEHIRIGGEECGSCNNTNCEFHNK